MDINTFPPKSGRIIGEDGQTHNLVDLLGAIAESNARPDTFMLALQPQLWTAGLEYNFGDGTYGRRFTATVWTAYNAVVTLQSNMGTNAKIIDCGGYAEVSTYPYNANMGRIPLGQTYSRGGVYAAFAMFLERDNTDNSSSHNLYLACDTLATTGSNWTYDVWVRYTR
jgi:hypothetical protein